MKKFLVLALFLAACSSPSAASSPTPSASGPTVSPSQSPSPTASPSATPSPTPIVLPSTAELSAPSGNVVWALVGGTRLFRSNDRGETWSERGVPAGLANVDIAFADDANGLLLSTGSPASQCQTQTVKLYKTADGAATWTQITATGIADAMCKNGLAVADATHAFFAASDPNDPAVVYRSADAGSTWQASGPLAGRSAAVYNTPGRPRAFGSVVFIDATPSQQSRGVFQSSDGGATFGLVSAAPIVESPVAFVTQTRWLQLGPPASSKETTDGGASWHAFTTDYSQAAPIAADVVFGDASVGYATVRGEIQRTIDGGAHWTKIKTPGTA
jgi:photosystem II stability/assembly factor-like uncharacterized protein